MTDAHAEILLAECKWAGFSDIELGDVTIDHVLAFQRLIQGIADYQGALPPLKGGNKFTAVTYSDSRIPNLIALMRQARFTVREFYQATQLRSLKYLRAVMLGAITVTDTAPLMRWGRNVTSFAEISFNDYLGPATVIDQGTLSNQTWHPDILQLLAPEQLPRVWGKDRDYTTKGDVPHDVAEEKFLGFVCNRDTTAFNLAAIEEVQKRPYLWPYEWVKKNSSGQGSLIVPGVRLQTKRHTLCLLGLIFSSQDLFFNLVEPHTVLLEKNKPLIFIQSNKNDRYWSS